MSAPHPPSPPSQQGQHVICAPPDMLKRLLAEAGNPGLEVDPARIVWSKCAPRRAVGAREEKVVATGGWSRWASAAPLPHKTHTHTHLRARLLLAGRAERLANCPPPFRMLPPTSDPTPSGTRPNASWRSTGPEGRGMHARGASAREPSLPAACWVARVAMRNGGRAVAERACTPRAL